MLPLFRDALQVVLAPDEIILVRFSWKMTWRGPVRRYVEQQQIPVPSAKEGELAWKPLVQALDEKFSAMNSGIGPVQVILANRLVRYAMIPWSNTVLSAAEEMSYVGHCFSQIYGEEILQSEFRLNDAGLGQPRLASAVDKDLLQAIREVVAKVGARVTSIRPALMTAFNASIKETATTNGWFAMHEPGNLFLALLEAGNIIRVRSLRVGEGWREALMRTLDRESLHELKDVSEGKVLLWAPAVDCTNWPVHKHWKIQSLVPQMQPGYMQEAASSNALILNGGW